MPKHEPWFCDFCMHVEKEKVLKEKYSNGKSKTASETALIECSGIDNCGDSGSHPSATDSDQSNRKKRVKKRRKTKFYNDKKAKRKRQMLISASLESDVIKQNSQRLMTLHQPSYDSESCEGTLCFFCKLPYGVMMKLAKPANTWGHLSCGYWLPHTNPYIPYRMIYISARGLAELAKPNQQQCVYCKGDQGMMTKCFDRECNITFHVECGRRSFCELKFPYQLKMKQKEHVVFCFQHSQTYNSRRIEQTISTEWSQMKGVLKGFKNHHAPSLHFDLKWQAKRVRTKRLVVHLKTTQIGRDNVVYSYVKTTFD